MKSMPKMFTDAETLIQNAKHQEVKVQNVVVQVSLYWPGIQGG